MSSTQNSTDFKKKVSTAHAMLDVVTTIYDNSMKILFQNYSYLISEKHLTQCVIKPFE